MQLTTLIITFIFMFGLIFGSFLNVLIYRLPREMSPAKGGSMCPVCNHPLGSADLVPVASWLLLRGKCRYCGEKISWQYPAVELLNAVLYVCAYLKFGMTIEAAAWAVVISCLIGVAVCDAIHMIIPDTFNVGIGLAGLALLIVSDNPTRISRLIGAVCVSGVLLAISLISKGRAMGGGDIKLMAALGLCLGWQSVLLTTFLGSLLGTLVMAVFNRSKLKRGTMVPFGTFLAAAGIFCVFFGAGLISWYIAFNKSLEHTHEHDH